MIEYKVSGFIDINMSGFPILCKNKGDINNSINLIENIKDFILKNSDIGVYVDKDDTLTLGGEIHTIPNCNIMIWFSRGEKTIEEVQKSMTAILYGGSYSTDIDYEGYSEFTITDYTLNNFTIGGHDLRRIFESKRGKYCNFVLQAYTPVKGLTYSNVYKIKQNFRLPSGKEVPVHELMNVIQNLSYGNSIVISNKDIEWYLKYLDLIYDDCVSHSSVSAKDTKEMENLYDELEQMLCDFS